MLHTAAPGLSSRRPKLPTCWLHWDSFQRQDCGLRPQLQPSIDERLMHRLPCAAHMASAHYGVFVSLRVDDHIERCPLLQQQAAGSTTNGGERRLVHTNSWSGSVPTSLPCHLNPDLGSEGRAGRGSSRPFNDTVSSLSDNLHCNFNCIRSTLCAPLIFAKSRGWSYSCGGSVGRGYIALSTGALCDVDVTEVLAISQNPRYGVDGLQASNGECCAFGSEWRLKPNSSGINLACWCFGVVRESLQASRRIPCSALCFPQRIASASRDDSQAPWATPPPSRRKIRLPWQMRWALSCWCLSQLTARADSVPVLIALGVLARLGVRGHPTNFYSTDHLRAPPRHAGDSNAVIIDVITVFRTRSAHMRLVLVAALRSDSFVTWARSVQS
ncbi:hypothetical protein CMUS01_05577 [Colletotrichum musicola]|uniref:Uncharacterized protein n=1 Tax=Colletotrichum musicola TaxID=2175873 RepID=A0A8H6NJJ7_9PEZI|nr:hypothetical protein CMUS01_05577 [Colletotrichum musicola]